VNGQLNSTSLSKYVFNDYFAVPGINYYRLSQTDVDGKARTMKTIAVDNTCLKGEGTEVSVSYNQEQNELNIGFLVEHNQLVHVAIYNAMGQLVHYSDIDFYAADRQVVLQLTKALTFGMYFVNLSNESFTVSNKVLISK
jgi:hypothetical protein